MFGENPKRPPEIGDGQSLDIQEVFPTLQGEGPFVGQPAVFVRLGGCNLACDFCDTDFEGFRRISLNDILHEVEVVAQNEEGVRTRKLVVITGGEPLRQNIVPMCEALLGKGFKVQIETNGTLYLPLPEGVNIVCSPKNTGQGYHAIRPDLLERIDALKFIISARDFAYMGVEEVGQTARNLPVYVQPMDEQEEEQNTQNLQYTARLAQQNGYILSLQTHKILGIK